MHSVCHIQSDPLHLSVGSSSYFSLCISCEKMHLLQLHLKNREHLSIRKTFWKDISAKSLTLTLQYMYCFTTWMKPNGSGRWPGSVGAAVCSRTPFTALNISSTVVLLHSYWSSCPVQPAIGVSAGGGAGPHGPCYGVAICYMGSIFFCHNGFLCHYICMQKHIQYWRNVFLWSRTFKFAAIVVQDHYLRYEISLLLILQHLWQLLTELNQCQKCSSSISETRPHVNWEEITYRSLSGRQEESQLPDRCLAWSAHVLLV